MLPLSLLVIVKILTMNPPVLWGAPEHVKQSYTIMLRGRKNSKEEGIEAINGAMAECLDKYDKSVIMTGLLYNKDNTKYKFILFDGYLITVDTSWQVSIMEYNKCFNLRKCTIRLEESKYGIWKDKIDVESYSYIDKSNQKSVTGRAVVGGLLFGGAGAVVGALSAVDHNSKHPEEEKKEIKIHKTKEWSEKDGLVLTIKRPHSFSRSYLCVGCCPPMNSPYINYFENDDESKNTKVRKLFLLAANIE